MNFIISFYPKCSLFSALRMSADSIYRRNFKCLLQRNMSNRKNNYKEAVEKLNYLQSNTTMLKECQLRESKGIISKSPHETTHFLKRIGITMEEIDNNLSVIHVSGTKGKGSTCAYCESILREHGYKTGFFSSPHLVVVRERIRINGQPISESDFTYFFWDVYRKLEDNSVNHKENFNHIFVVRMHFELKIYRKQDDGSMPFYFQFLTLMAIKIFIKEKVDVAIIEVGIGGEKDSTNIFSATPVVGISSLGLDHTKLLGDTVEKIAWQKAGIMKKGCIAVTSMNQPHEALNVLYNCAKEKQCVLVEAPPLEEYSGNHAFNDLQTFTSIHALNASLGIQLAYAWMAKTKNCGSLDNIGKGFQLNNRTLSGINSCFWPGRQQIIYQRNGELNYFIDGAHTYESMVECANWFKRQEQRKNDTRILLFNLTSYRDASSLLQPLISCQFDFVIFCTNISKRDLNYSPDQKNYNLSTKSQISRCKDNEKVWRELNNTDNKASVIETFMTVQDSVDFINKLPGYNRILVTGSLHLVGAFFSVVGPEIVLHDTKSTFDIDKKS